MQEISKRILILSANPKDTCRLRLEQEVREIKNGLSAAPNRKLFSLEYSMAVREIDIRRTMLEYKPNIVHFCGHGAGEDGLVFEDEKGYSKRVSSDTLAEFFSFFNDNLECIILNACYSEKQAFAISKHINYVIGMNKAINDTIAIDFAVAFYDSLYRGKSYEFSYDLACNAIQWKGVLKDLTPIMMKRGNNVNEQLNWKEKIFTMCNGKNRIAIVEGCDVSNEFKNDLYNLLSENRKSIMFTEQVEPFTYSSAIKDNIEIADLVLFIGAMSQKSAWKDFTEKIANDNGVRFVYLDYNSV